MKSVKHPLVIAPDSEACVPRTASRTEFECLAANFQSLKGPKREPLWNLVICWWDWELKFGAWVGNKGTHHLFCFSVYTICVCNCVYIYIQKYIWDIHTHSAQGNSNGSASQIGSSKTLLDYPDLNHPGAGSRTSKCFSGAAGFCKDR